jgi:hypothetical protein
MTQTQLENIIGNLQNRHNDNILLDNLNDAEIYALLAWEMWKDGEDWDLVAVDIPEGIYLPFNTRESASNELINKFGYKKNQV